MRFFKKLALVVVAVLAVATLAYAASTVTTLGNYTATHYSDGSTVMKVQSAANVYFYAHLTSAQTTTLRTTLCGGCTLQSASADTGTAPTDDKSVPYVFNVVGIGNNN